MFHITIYTSFLEKLKIKIMLEKLSKEEIKDLEAKLSSLHIPVRSEKEFWGYERKNIIKKRLYTLLCIILGIYTVAIWIYVFSI